MIEVIIAYSIGGETLYVLNSTLMEQVSKVAKLFQGEILIQGVLAPYVFYPPT